MQTTSKQFSVDKRDIIRGFFIAVSSPVFTILLTSLNAGSLTFDWKIIGTVAAAAGLTYISKNFFTPSQIVISDEKTVQSVTDGDAAVKVVKK